MIQEAVSAWPLIPLSVMGVMVVVAFAGLIAMLYDSGARDTTWVTGVGVTLLGIGLAGCLSIGCWNFMVGVAHFTTMQAEVANASAGR